VFLVRLFCASRGILVVSKSIPTHRVIPAQAGIHPEMTERPQRVEKPRDGFRPAPE
jgi:hypothetical protein